MTCIAHFPVLRYELSGSSINISTCGRNRSKLVHKGPIKYFPLILEVIKFVIHRSVALYVPPKDTNEIQEQKLGHNLATASKFVCLNRQSPRKSRMCRRNLSLTRSLETFSSAISPDNHWWVLLSSRGLRGLSSLSITPTQATMLFEIGYRRIFRCRTASS